MRTAGNMRRTCGPIVNSHSTITDRLYYRVRISRPQGNTWPGVALWAGGPNPVVQAIRDGRMAIHNRAARPPHVPGGPHVLRSDVKELYRALGGRTCDDELSA